MKPSHFTLESHQTEKSSPQNTPILIDMLTSKCDLKVFFGGPFYIVQLFMFLLEHFKWI